MNAAQRNDEAIHSVYEIASSSFLLLAMTIVCTFSSQ